MDSDNVDSIICIKASDIVLHSVLFRCLVGISSYIHNWPLQPFSQDYDLASHTTHIVCFNFIREWWDLQFNIDSERQIFEKIFYVKFLFTLRVLARNLLRGNRWRNAFFWCLAWDTNPNFTSSKPTHYLLDYGDCFHKFLNSFRRPELTSLQCPPPPMYTKDFSSFKNYSYIISRT